MNHRYWFRESSPPPPSSFASCKELMDAGYNRGDGLYQITPVAGQSPVTVECDMTRQGGGWTLGVKHWYQSGLESQGASAYGDVKDALTKKGTPYKLSDEHIQGIIGEDNYFDILFDQKGYNNAYSSGNKEYVVVRGYTAEWTWAGNVAASSTTTSMTSYRRDDNAIAAHFNFDCESGNGGNGVNCDTVAAGSINPSGGSGCDINMGGASSSGYRDLMMSRNNADTYMYICNGPQHSSSYDMNHRYWFRSSAVLPGHIQP